MNHVLLEFLYLIHSTKEKHQNIENDIMVLKIFPLMLITYIVNFADIKKYSTYLICYFYENK